MFTTQMGFTGLWNQKRAFITPRLSLCCLGWSVAPAGSSGCPWSPDIPRALQGALLLSAAANCSPAGKGKKRGKQPFLCDLGTQFNGGLRHNNLYKGKRRRNDALESFPWSESGAAFQHREHSREMGQEPRAESSLHLHFHSSPSDKCVPLEKSASRTECWLPQTQGSRGTAGSGRMGSRRGGTASQNPARGGPWTPPAQLRPVTPEQPQKVRAAPPRQQGQQQP